MNQKQTITNLIFITHTIRCALFKPIVKVIRPMYCKLKVDNHRFIIYHLYYKEKHEKIQQLG